MDAVGANRYVFGGTMVLVLPSMSILSGDPSSRKPPETHGNGRFSRRTMVGKNGESTHRIVIQKD